MVGNEILEVYNAWIDRLSRIWTHNLYKNNK